jgi:hypothetical protein
MTAATNVQLAEAKHYDGKEVNIMKYETPELTALTPAISAIQSVSQQKTGGVEENEHDIPLSAYEDSE